MEYTNTYQNLLGHVTGGRCRRGSRASRAFSGEEGPGGGPVTIRRGPLCRHRQHCHHPRQGGLRQGRADCQDPIHQVRARGRAVCGIGLEVAEQAPRLPPGGAGGSPHRCILDREVQQGRRQLCTEGVCFLCILASRASGEDRQGVWRGWRGG